MEGEWREVGCETVGESELVVWWWRGKGGRGMRGGGERVGGYKQTRENLTPSNMIRLLCLKRCTHHLSSSTGSQAKVSCLIIYNFTDHLLTRCSSLMTCFSRLASSNRSSVGGRGWSKCKCNWLTNDSENLQHTLSLFGRIPRPHPVLSTHTWDDSISIARACVPKAEWGLAMRFNFD